MEPAGPSHPPPAGERRWEKHAARANEAEIAEVAAQTVSSKVTAPPVWKSRSENILVNQVFDYFSSRALIIFPRARFDNFSSRAARANLCLKFLRHALIMTPRGRSGRCAGNDET